MLNYPLHNITKHTAGWVGGKENWWQVHLYKNNEEMVKGIYFPFSPHMCGTDWWPHTKSCTTRFKGVKRGPRYT
jgi:hypothetical protein